MRPKDPLAFVPFLAMAGTGIAGFLLANHYRAVEADFCTVTSWTDCDAVNHSPYATILGVPVATLGLAGFAAIAAMALEMRMRETPFFRPVHLLALSLAGVGFGTYLTAVEVFVLKVLCLLCVASFLLGVAVAVLAWRAVRAGPRPVIEVYT